MRAKTESMNIVSNITSRNLFTASIKAPTISFNPYSLILKLQSEFYSKSHESYEFYNVKTIHLEQLPPI